MKKLSKLITWPLIFIFLYQNIGWTAPSDISQVPQAIFIPEQYGRVEKTNRQTGKQANGQTVVLIKDAHCNYEAQTNIAKILDILIRDYKIDLIGEEGASGYINPSIVLESNPKEEIRKNVSDKFLKSGLLVASEALSINKGKEPGFTIWGVEDLRLYLEDYKAFRDTVGTNPKGKRFIELLSKTIDQLKKKIYPEELQGFDGLVKGYESNEIPLSRFIRVLYYDYGIPKNYKNLKLILKSIRLEEKIDFNKVERERADLIKELEKALPEEDLQELVKQSLLYKLGKIPAVSYYKYLEPLAIRHPILARYIKLIKLQDKLDEAGLFTDLEILLENIYIKLCTDKTSLNLHQLDRNINILNKIFTLEATRENLIYYKENQIRFTPENLLQFIKIQAPLNNITLTPELNDPSFIENVRAAITPAEEFYRLAIERDVALVENLLLVMQKNKKDKAVLVCGGFHAEGIKKILEDKGISILTIIPSITKIQENCQEIYLRRMLDERIDPEKMLLELGLETLRPAIATGPQGRQLGLPQDIIEALGGRVPASLGELTPLLKRLYAEGNETLRSSIDKWIRDYNASLPEGEERIVLEPAGPSDIIFTFRMPSHAAETKMYAASKAAEIFAKLINTKGKEFIEPSLTNIYGSSFSLDNIAEVIFEYHASGSQKDVYKITFKTQEGREGIIAFAAAYKEAIERFEEEELDHLKELRGSGLVPKFGAGFEIDNHMVYLEEWIQGPTAYELLKEGNLSMDDKKKIIKVIMRVQKALKGEVPIDLNLGNFIYDTVNSRMVLVDIGFVNASAPATLLSDILLDYGPLPAMQFNGAGELVNVVYEDEDFAEASFDYAFDAIIDALGKEEGAEFLASAMNDTTGVIEKVIQDKIRAYLSSLESSKPESWEFVFPEKSLTPEELAFRSWEDIEKELEATNWYWRLLDKKTKAKIKERIENLRWLVSYLLTETDYGREGRIQAINVKGSYIWGPDKMPDHRPGEYRPHDTDILVIVKGEGKKEVEHYRPEKNIAYQELLRKIQWRSRQLDVTIVGDSELNNLNRKYEDNSKLDENEIIIQDRMVSARCSGITIAGWTYCQNIPPVDLISDKALDLIEAIGIELGEYQRNRANAEELLQQRDEHIRRFGHFYSNGDNTNLATILREYRGKGYERGRKGKTDLERAIEFKEEHKIEIRPAILSAVRVLKRIVEVSAIIKFLNSSGPIHYPEDYPAELQLDNIEATLNELLQRGVDEETLGYMTEDIVDAIQNTLRREIKRLGRHNGPRTADDTHIDRPTTLKAPGSDPLDEDSGEKAHIEEVIKNIHETRDQKDAIIHTIDLGRQLGIPRFSNAILAKDLIYAYGRKEADGKLHIYVTEAFWSVLAENPLMLTFLLDHEWQENMSPIPKSHVEASRRAWQFVDENGMNPFYKFFIDLAAREGDIETLQGLTGKHENDPDGRFRQYVQNTIFGTRNIQEIRQFRDEMASHFGGRQPRILNITHTTDLSTGLSEVVKNFIKFGRDMGMEIEESVPQIRDFNLLTRFFQIAVNIRHAIQGDRGVEVSDIDWEFFERVNQMAFADLEKEIKNTDIIVLHNHYYLGLVPLIKRAKPDIRIIWQCHLEVGDPDLKVWNRLKAYIEYVDLVILQPRTNFRDVYYRLDITPPAVFLPPAIINPVSEKHEYINTKEAEDILKQNGVDPARPYFLYTGRYDKEKNINDVIHAFAEARGRLGKRSSPQLVIAGTAVNEEETAVYKEISALKEEYPELSADIIIIPPEVMSDRLTNALQQGAFAGLQLAHREGFGLAVAEVMWKGKPVIGRNTGGIAMQVQDAQTGYLVDTVTEAASCMVDLLEDPQLAQDMGKRAREYVYNNYLITQLISNYELAFISTKKRPTVNRAVNADALRKQLWESIIIKTTHRLQEELLNAIKRKDTKTALDIMQRLQIIHDFIWSSLTENGTASVLVIEKLKDILFDKLRQGRTDEQIDLACITLPIASINRISYERADQFKKIFYQRLEDYFRREKRPIYVAYEQLHGKYYGFAKTRLYVIGLGEEDLERIVREVFPECLKELKEIGITDTKDFHMYAGHKRISLTGELIDTFQDENETGVLEQTAHLVEKLINDDMADITGRAEVAENMVQRPVFGERDTAGLAAVTSEMGDRIEKALEEGKRKYISENEYSKNAYIPRLGHMFTNLNRLWQILYSDLKDGTPLISRGLQAYLYVLNKYLLESLQDNRYKNANKKDGFNAILSARREDLPGYLQWLRDIEPYTAKIYSIIASWRRPLRITKLGDEIWLYMEMEDGDIEQHFGELDKFNAFNENYPPDIRDSFYHQILDAIFSLHKMVNHESAFSPLDVERYAGSIGSYLQNLWITIPDTKTYNNPAGYMPVTSPAVVLLADREITIVESRNLLKKGIRAGERHKLKRLVCHYSEKVMINGEIQRLKLYEAKDRRTGETRRFVIYNRRIYTADGKGEDNENDITDEIMQNLDNRELSPVTGHVDITFTTDHHNLLALDPSRISDLNTYQKKHLNKKIADVSEIIAAQIISILERHGVTGIAEKDMAGTIVQAKKGEIDVNFIELWGLVKGWIIEPEKFFEIAADISKPLNTLLGPEARAKGAQMLNAILKEIIETLPEKERKEILTREKLTDKERLLAAIKKAAEQKDKGIDPDAIQNIFDLFEGGMDILILDPDLDIGEFDGAYIEVIRQLEVLTGMGAILNAFRRAFRIDVRIKDARQIKDSPLKKEAGRLEEYNREYSKETMALNEVDNNLWDILFTERTVLETKGGARTRNQFLSALDVVKKDVDKIVKLLRGGPVELKEPSAVVVPIEMLIELHPDGTFSYKPGIESILKNLYLQDITIGVMVKEGDTRYDNILSVIDKRLRIIRGDAARAQIELGILSNRIAFLFKDKSNIPKNIKAIFVDEATPLHVAILFGVVYARIEVFDERGELTSRAKEVLGDFLKRIGNMKDDEIRKILDELNRQGYFTLRLIRIAETLREFRNRKLLIEVAA